MIWREQPWMLAILIGMCLVTTMDAKMEAKTNVSKQPFGKTTDGTAVDLYTLTEGATEIRIMTYGGIIQSIKIPDREGKSADVVLGFDSLDTYVTANNPFFGALIGRYGNRIAHGTFQLDGKTFSIPKNNGDNSLHGGTRGFDKVVWEGKPIENGVELKYLSKDGDQGFPGNLLATVRYTLKDGGLHIDYSATTDKDTVVNLTNHSYFNLAGEGSGEVLAQHMKINASRFLPVDSNLIPTGELKPVAGTPFDFLKTETIGARIDADDPQLGYGKGYDHTWVLDRKAGDDLIEAARAEDPASGRVLRVLTTEPGVQFYSANSLVGPLAGKSGHIYNRRGAFCLETQHFPDSPNHPAFPTTELKAGKRYHTVTVFQFSAEKATK